MEAGFNWQRWILNEILNYLQSPLSAFVFIFVDTLVYTRSESDILKNTTPDEHAFRSLTSGLVRTLSPVWNLEVFGWKKYNRYSYHWPRRNSCSDWHKGLWWPLYRQAWGNKYGRNLQTKEPNTTLVIDHPEHFKMPSSSSINNYLIATEDYYFVYPTHYHQL